MDNFSQGDWVIVAWRWRYARHGQEFGPWNYSEEKPPLTNDLQKTYRVLVEPLFRPVR